MKIRLNESDIFDIVKKCILTIKEDVEYRYDPKTNKMDASIKHSTLDKDNAEVDTRIFGTKDQIFNGDGTLTGKRRTTFKDKELYGNNAKNIYLTILSLIQNKQPININIVNNIPLNTRTLNTIKEKIEDYNSGELSPEEMSIWAQKMCDLHDTENQLNQNKSQRFNSYNDDEKHFRYDEGKVPGTNVDFISLFRMNDFNFSDLIKHGELRQNGETDKMLGITTKDRATNDKLFGKGKSTLKKLPTTYDNGITPDVANNFSLSNDYLINDPYNDNGYNGHFKKQYQTKKDGYTSITQFMDKSVLYAANVLKEINYIPDYIIAPPSSSNYNEYYCTNLSRKIGKPYINNFFDRNITNVVCDEELMKRNGLTDKDIFTFKTKVKAEISREVADICAQPIMKFAKTYEQYFNSIIKSRGNRYAQSQYYDFTAIAKVLCQMSANALINNINAQKKDILYKQICLKLASPTMGGGVVSIKNGGVIESIIQDIVHSRDVYKQYQVALLKMDKLILQYRDLLMTDKGIKLNMSSKKFKITDFDKRERPYLKNVYVVADKNLNANGEMFKRFQTAKFLIFDEDMNSGATLKLAIDALIDKLPQHNSGNIKCLVNCYSSSGK